MEQIKADQLNREYAQMVASVVKSDEQRFAFRIPFDELRQIRGYLATIVNVSFSIIAVFVAVFVASATATDDTGIVSISCVSSSCVFDSVFANNRRVQF
ncbi:hypothetical protein BCR43DRAFT_484877 [Syncephalastrum racemosum]|uniref:Uncharacterized protein n=1 Tax=Syncephalastrum racemosum TaxID=13706 RepID=A0A1X2HLI8_SYNRA|nr:hypothetical protein BCR43DRAFT_484877 [Syncephalastrum racemosum]